MQGIIKNLCGTKNLHQCKCFREFQEEEVTENEIYVKLHFENEKAHVSQEKESTEYTKTTDSSEGDDPQQDLDAEKKKRYNLRDRNQISRSQYLSVMIADLSTLNSFEQAVKSEYSRQQMEAIHEKMEFLKRNNT